MREKEMVKLFGKGFAKAIELECAKNNWTLAEFFKDFIDWSADDEFFDFMMDLCEKHDIFVSDDDWDQEDE